MRVDDGHYPHLTLEKVDSLDVRFGQAKEGDGMRSRWVVGVLLPSDIIGPELAITVQGAGAVALDVDAVAGPKIQAVGWFW